MPAGIVILTSQRISFSTQMKIDGKDVVVWSKDVTKPVAVRYAWADNPICNLYNAVDLPASPFRTDNWPGITVNRK